MSKKLPTKQISLEQEPVNKGTETTPIDQQYPIVTAIALHKSSDLHDSFVCLTIQIQNGIVIAVESTEPNMKVITLDVMKVAFVKNFVQKEF